MIKILRVNTHKAGAEEVVEMMVGVLVQNGYASLIAEDELDKITATERTFSVQSMTHDETYEVKLSSAGNTCTCPDFVFRQGECKHICSCKKQEENKR